MSAPLWLPGAIVRKGKKDGGSMVGGPARMTWHSYEADPGKLSAVAGAERLIVAGNDLHFVLNPLTGDIVQIIPANRAGRGLANKPGGVQTNRQGSVNLQVEVIAYAAKPFTSYITKEGAAAVRRLVAFGAEHGVPRLWPAGPPVDYKISHPASHYPRPEATWTSFAGHYAHSQVPENYHGDPGAIDVSLWVEPASTSPGPQEPKKSFGRPVLARILRVTRTPYMRGADVGEVQKLVGVKADRIYGLKTGAAVLAAQKAYNKRYGKKLLAEDGEVGPKTAKALGMAWKG